MANRHPQHSEEVISSSDLHTSAAQGCFDPSVKSIGPENIPDPVHAHKARVRAHKRAHLQAVRGVMIMQAVTHAYLLLGVVPGHSA